MTKLAKTQDVSDKVYDEATRVFTEDQYRVVAWAITVIDAFNRLGATSREPLPNPSKVDATANSADYGVERQRNGQWR